MRRSVNQPDRKTYFIADAHLGADTSEHERLKEQYISSFLQTFPLNDSRLLICGDLFDFWFEYRHAVPRRHFHVLAQLARLCRSGVPIDYIAGNHDFWLGSFLQKEIGMTLHRDDMILFQGQQRIYIRHGDGLLKKDHLYRLLKKILRFRPNIFLYRLLHPDLGIPLALFFSHLSRGA
ncbi:UDP-2,3-diacylglucosamine diphosphatase, partial [candidate division KSB1 bacterium]|nr:UDP-2,3-diacylglucosamine diphosphatase [candidate division KSB1 bacterium]